MRSTLSNQRRKPKSSGNEMNFLTIGMKPLEILLEPYTDNLSYLKNMEDLNNISIISKKLKSDL